LFSLSLALFLSPDVDYRSPRVTAVENQVFSEPYFLSAGKSIAEKLVTVF